MHKPPIEPPTLRKDNAILSCSISLLMYLIRQFRVEALHCIVVGRAGQVIWSQFNWSLPCQVKHRVRTYFPSQDNRTSHCNFNDVSIELPTLRKDLFLSYFFIIMRVCSIVLTFWAGTVRNHPEGWKVNTKSFNIEVLI